jgi:hypothetical protein
MFQVSESKFFFGQSEKENYNVSTLMGKKKKRSVRKNCEDDSDDALICQDSATPDCYDSRTK